MTELLAATSAYLPGILILLCCSGFFSGSEAAFFSLTPGQRLSLAEGNRAARVAAGLVAQSERLLMGVLFWNLAINIGYFTLVSRVCLELDAAADTTGGSGAAIVTIAALLIIILVGEFVPKSIAVLYPLFIVRIVFAR